MADAAAEAGRRPPAWLLAALLALGVVLAAAAMGRPFHADEAGQWSLAAEGRPHSLTGDRFHGPALGLSARAAAAVAGQPLAEASAAFLRSVPVAFALSLAFIPWALPSDGRRGWVAGLLALPVVLLSARFIQEPLMAAALVWSAALWLRAGPEGAARPRLLSGLCAGLALACKVTAALHLGLAAAAVLLLRRSAPGWRGFAAFLAGLVASWALGQSSLFTDLPALSTWWKQLFRAFGVATGASEPPLPMGSPAPWIITALLLAIALGCRMLPRRDAARASGRPEDVLLLAAAAAYAVHLSLPYKTPWLLLTPDAILLVLVLPALASATGFLRGLVPVAAGLATVAAADRHDYVETSADVPALAAALREPDSRPELVLVRGDHVWPFPFYLRGLRVGYGAVPDPAQAEVWILQASGSEPPQAEGRRAIAFAVRDNELWWALAPEPLAGRLEAALRAAR